MTISITNAELTVMQALWSKSPLTARQITEQTTVERDWHRKTVNTLLARLVKKSAIEVFGDDGGPKRYAPLIEKQDYALAVTSKLVDRLFGGDIAPLVANFAGGRKLNREQIEELKELLEDLSDDN